METMARKKSRPRRSFTPEFKVEIVGLCQRGDRSVGQGNPTVFWEMIRRRTSSMR